MNPKFAASGTAKWQCRLLPIMVGLLAGLLCYPTPALAFMPHWDPEEAFFVRQFAYLFWALAILFFIFELRQQKLQQYRSFRLLARSGGFFVAWNIVCFIGQFIRLILAPNDRAEPAAAFVQGLAYWLYVITKLDNLLLAPAFIFLYLGIRAFGREGTVRPQ